jgi:hypothetical protein
MKDPIISLIAAVLMFGCAAYPQALELFGLRVPTEELTELVREVGEENGWGDFTADQMESVIAKVQERRASRGLPLDEPIGARELIETVIGGGFLLNWVRNRKYNVVRVPKGENKA